MISIPIVASQKPRGIKIISYSLLAVVAIFISLFFLYPTTDQIGIFFLGAVGILLVFLLFTKKHPLIGNLKLTLGEIEIKSISKHHTIPISEVKSLDLKYSGYHGQSDILNFSFFSGMDNVITIYFNNRKISFFVLLEQQHLTKLNQLMDSWKKETEMEINITNLWGTKIERIPIL